MEASVVIDGREVRFRATAAVPRLYRIKFRRDILQDFKALQKAMGRAQEDAGEGEVEDTAPSSPLPMEALDRAQEDAGEGEVEDTAPSSPLPVEALELFEDMAYIMAKHADPEGVPGDPGEWLDTFGMFSIYQVFPVIRALWEGNTEAMELSKKKREQ